MLKYLLLIAIVLAVLWIARTGRRRVNPPPGRRDAGNGANEAMVACAQCGLHLPSGEALPGRGGVFCSEGHRAAYEKEHASR